jgi:hypothetical protein
VIIMAATAKTKQSVQSQNARDRAWDELEATYSQERAESDKAYDQNKAAFTRGQESKGMQRSSYTGQAAAGYDKEKINAQNRSYENQIAAYQSAVDSIEQREAEERYRSQQLALQQAQLEQSQKQFEAQLAYNKEQAALSQQNWERQFEQTNANTAWSQNYQQSQADLAQKNTEWSQNYQQQQADIAQQNTAWNQAFQQSQANLAQQNTEWNQNFQQQQANRSQSQWEQEFGYQQQSDDQKIAYNYAMAMLQNGQRPSDDLLKRAGLSTADANTMLGESTSGSGPVITWRQAADAAAKAAGYTGRNDGQIEADAKKGDTKAINLAQAINNIVKGTSSKGNGG